MTRGLRRSLSALTVAVLLAAHVGAAGPTGASLVLQRFLALDAYRGFIMIAFYWLIEVKGYRKWAFSLVVVEMNSIFIHSVGQVLKGGADRAVAVFTFRYTSF